MNNPSKVLFKRAINLAIISAFVLTAAFTFAPISPALAAECAVNHVVVSGETISSIAFQYDVDWQEVATANNLTDPYTIFVNQTLCIPASATTSTSSSSSSSSTSSGSSTGFDLTRDSTRVYVSTTGFKKKSSYFVKIRNGGTTDIEWYKLDDILLTQGSGSVEASFRLPVEYRHVKVLVVCFKNMVNDSLICNTVLENATVQ